MSLRVDVRPAGKSVGVKAKPSKTNAEVLRSVLSKYDYLLDDFIVRVVSQLNVQYAHFLS